MIRILKLIFCVVICFTVIPVTNSSAESAQEIIKFKDWGGPALKVYLLQPVNAQPNAPVVFVMHGVNRDADRYFEEWRPLAEKYGFVLVVPEFSSRSFPKAAKYNLGGVVDAKGGVTRREHWAYSAIEPLFDAVVERYALDADEYVLYGHSAGAQFAHRFALFGAGQRARMVISANAGWYTFPDAGAWPYGPNGLPGGVYDPLAALGASLVVLAGEADIDPNHPSLRRTSEAFVQGATRFERAQTFYAAGADLAARMKVEFHWSCVTAPDVDHNDKKAAPFAVTLILAESRSTGEPCYRGTPSE